MHLLSNFTPILCIFWLTRTHNRGVADLHYSLLRRPVKCCVKINFYFLFLSMLLSVLHGLLPLRSDRTVPSLFFFLSTPLLLAELGMPERNLGWLQVKSCEGYLDIGMMGGHLDSVTSTCCCGMPPARWIKIEILIQPPAFSRGGYSAILISLRLLLGDFCQSHWRPLNVFLAEKSRVFPIIKIQDR